MRSIDLGIKHGQISVAVALCAALPRRHRLIDEAASARQTFSVSAASVGWLPTIAQRAREASIVLVDIHCDASPGIVDTLIAAEAMRTVILLMSELHKVSCYEETYRSADLSAIERESFGVRLWCAG